MGNASINVRPATPRDADTLAEMRYELRSGMRSAAEDAAAFVVRCAGWMRERLGGGVAWRCWVAEQGGEIVGTIWLQVVEKIPNPVGEIECHGYVTNFFVRQPARGAGVGSALLVAMLGASETRRLDALILWPTERSRRLYARHGFTARDDIVERRPAAGADASGLGHRD